MVKIKLLQKLGWLIAIAVLALAIVGAAIAMLCMWPLWYLAEKHRRSFNPNLEVQWWRVLYNRLMEIVSRVVLPDRWK